MHAEMVTFFKKKFYKKFSQLLLMGLVGWFYRMSTLVGFLYQSQFENSLDYKGTIIRSWWTWE